MPLRRSWRRPCRRVPPGPVSPGVSHLGHDREVPASEVGIDTEHPGRRTPGEQSRTSTARAKAYQVGQVLARSRDRRSRNEVVEHCTYRVRRSAEEGTSARSPSCPRCRGSPRSRRGLRRHPAIGRRGRCRHGGGWGDTAGGDGGQGLHRQVHGSVSSRTSPPARPSMRPITTSP